MPLPVTPVGSFSRHLAALVYLVAASTKFQTIVGAANADAALAFIHWPHAPDDTPARPRAIVQPSDAFDIAGLGTGTWSETGDAWLSFEFLPATTPADPKADILTFMNQIGEIADEMIAISRSGAASPAVTETYLNIKRMKLIEGPSSSIPEEENGVLFYGVTWCLFW